MDKVLRLIISFSAGGGGNRSIWTTSVLSNVEFMHKYMSNSLVKNSPEMTRIQEAVREAGIFVVLGYSERAGASLYIAQVRSIPYIIASRKRGQSFARLMIGFVEVCCLLYLLFILVLYQPRRRNSASSAQNKTHPCRALHLGRRASRIPNLRR